MTPPKKLKILLQVWFVYILFSLIFPIILSIGFVNDLVGQTLPGGLLGLFVVMFLIVFILQISFLRHLRMLWTGQTTNDMFLRIMSGLQLLSFPIGTALAVFSFIVLEDSETKTFLNKGQPVMTKEELLKEVYELKK